MKNKAKIIERKVRNGLFAYKYPDGWITIGEERYLYYTIAQAIAKYRAKYPIRKNRKKA